MYKASMLIIAAFILVTAVVIYDGHNIKTSKSIDKKDILFEKINNDESISCNGVTYKDFGITKDKVLVYTKNDIKTFSFSSCQ
jgi:hypothetical protein